MKIHWLLTHHIVLRPLSGLVEEIQANNAHFMKCWADGDFKTLSQIYTEDCKIMPTGCDTQIGRQGRQSSYYGRRKHSKSGGGYMNSGGPS